MRLRTRYTQRLPVAPGLRLDIPFFEGSGTKVLDVSGKGNHGTITDAVWTRDENGVGMSFNGTSAYINCGNDPSLNITDAITIEAWVKMNVLPAANEELVFKNCYAIQGKPGGGDYHWYTVGTSAARLVFSKSDWVMGQWYHIVCTYDKDGGTNNKKVYIDGNVQAQATITGSITDSLSDVLLIGGYTASGLTLNGTIDEVRIYAVALTAEQIKRRYEQTKRDYVRGS